MSYDVQTVTFRQTAATAVNVYRKVGQVKNELFWHARRAIASCNMDKVKGLALFLSQCGEQETWMKSPEAGQSQVKDIPDLWMQGKSDVKRAIEKGVDIMAVSSYHELRKQKNERSKATGKVDRAVAPAPREREPEQTVTEALKAGDVVDAKATTLCPEDLLEVVALLAPLPELSRKRAVTKILNIARVASQAERDNVAEGQRRRA